MGLCSAFRSFIESEEHDVVLVEEVTLPNYQIVIRVVGENVDRW